MSPTIAVILDHLHEFTSYLRTVPADKPFEEVAENAPNFLLLAACFSTQRATSDDAADTVGDFSRQHPSTQQSRHKSSTLAHATSTERMPDHLHLPHTLASSPASVEGNRRKRKRQTEDLPTANRSRTKRIASKPKQSISPNSPIQLENVVRTQRAVWRDEPWKFWEAPENQDGSGRHPSIREAIQSEISSSLRKTEVNLPRQSFWGVFLFELAHLFYIKGLAGVEGICEERVHSFVRLGCQFHAECVRKFISPDKAWTDEQFNNCRDLVRAGRQCWQSLLELARKAGKVSIDYGPLLFKVGIRLNAENMESRVTRVKNLYERGILDQSYKTGANELAWILLAHMFSRMGIQPPHYITRKVRRTSYELGVSGRTPTRDVTETTAPIETSTDHLHSEHGQTIAIPLTGSNANIGKHAVGIGPTPNDEQYGRTSAAMPANVDLAMNWERSDVTSETILFDFGPTPNDEQYGRTSAAMPANVDLAMNWEHLDDKNTCSRNSAISPGLRLYSVGSQSSIPVSGFP